MLEPLMLMMALHAPTDPQPSPSPSREAASARPNRGLPRSPEFAAAHSRLARDLHGALPSLYRGRYYLAAQETFRRCVAQREGRFTYNVIGGGGGLYQTTYQFRDGAWRRGLTFMMASESRITHDGLRAEARALIRKPMAQWGRYWIDRAFYTALNYNGAWSGRHHWDGGRWSC